MRIIIEINQTKWKTGVSALLKYARFSVFAVKAFLLSYPRTSMFVCILTLSVFIPVRANKDITTLGIIDFSIPDIPVEKEEHKTEAFDKLPAKDIKVKQENASAGIFDVVVWHIKYHEGFRPKPYRCAAGYLTVGYGFRIVDKKNWSIENLSEASASTLLHESLQHKYNRVCTSYMPSESGWERHEQMAVAMLSYNCNMGRFQNSSLWKYIRKYKKHPNQENKKKLHDSWLKWSYYKDPDTGKMVQSKGLKARREFEYKLFTGGQDFVNKTREETRKKLLHKMKTSKWYN